jgi:hypothetical protein
MRLEKGMEGIVEREPGGFRAAGKQLVLPLSLAVPLSYFLPRIQLF